MPRWNTVAIVGVGLIGGSIGLALRRRGLAGEIIGIGRHPASLKRALDLGAITSTSLKIDQGVVTADVVVVCTPVADIADHLLQAAAAAPSHALLTDAGSTKSSIVAKVEAALARGGHFAGSHPLAGSEKTGVEFARGDLFEGRVVVVTSTRRTKPDDVKAVGDFWTQLGATIVTMSPADHDKVLATTSHLPHLVASAVARATLKADMELTAGGWRDLTRIAAGDPELWAQILLDNRTNILQSLARFEKTVTEFQGALESGNSDKLRQLLTEGKNVRDALGN